MIADYQCRYKSQKAFTSPDPECSSGLTTFELVSDSVYKMKYSSLILSSKPEKGLTTKTMNMNRLSA